MEDQPMADIITANDKKLIDMAYSTTYRGTLTTYISHCDTERARDIIRGIIKDLRINGELE